MKNYFNLRTGKDVEYIGDFEDVEKVVTNKYNELLNTREYDAVLDMYFNDIEEMTLYSVEFADEEGYCGNDDYFCTAEEACEYIKNVFEYDEKLSAFLRKNTVIIDTADTLEQCFDTIVTTPVYTFQNTKS